jgi:hypothetical protein
LDLANLNLEVESSPHTYHRGVIRGCAAYTIFPARSRQAGRSESLTQERESILKEELRPLEAPGEPWLIKTNETIRLAPRAKQMVVGRLELPKHQEKPRLICVVSGKETLLKERVKQAQASDAFCRILRPGSQNSRSEYFTDLEGVLYKRRCGREPVLVVPHGLIREVIALNHDSVYASHPGWKRTLDIVSLRNWWPGIHKDVRQYVLKCNACQRRSGKHELKAPLGDVAEPSYAFQVAHCDTLPSLTKATVTSLHSSTN